jgi:hypothetical protein
VTIGGSSYIVISDVSVYGDTTNGVTLTIEPGVEVRFNQGVQLYIATNGGSKGALVAEGTEEAPILFTANTTLIKHISPLADR